MGASTQQLSLLLITGYWQELWPTE